MTRKTLISAVAGLALALGGGSALAGQYGQGIPLPGKGYGHVKHHGYGKHYSGNGHHRGYYRGYRHAPPRVVHYSRHVTHVHGPRCGHHGYGHYGSRVYYRDYRPYYRPYYRDYGRAAFSGYDDGLGYYIEFRY